MKSVWPMNVGISVSQRRTLSLHTRARDSFTGNERYCSSIIFELSSARPDAYVWTSLWILQWSSDREWFDCQLVSLDQSFHLVCRWPLVAITIWDLFEFRIVANTRSAMFRSRSSQESKWRQWGPSGKRWTFVSDFHLSTVIRPIHSENCPLYHQKAKAIEVSPTFSRAEDFPPAATHSRRHRLGSSVVTHMGNLLMLRYSSWSSASTPHDHRWW
jgi:hypothetical protein